MTEESENNATDLASAENQEKESGGGSENGAPELLEPEVLKRLPPEARKIVEAGLMVTAHRYGPMPNPLTEKALYVFQVGGTWRPRNELIYKGHIRTLWATNLESIKSHRENQRQAY